MGGMSSAGRRRRRHVGLTLSVAYLRTPTVTQASGPCSVREHLRINRPPRRPRNLHGPEAHVTKGPNHVAGWVAGVLFIRARTVGSVSLVTTVHGNVCRSKMGISA